MASASGVQHEKDETEGGFSVGKAQRRIFARWLKMTLKRDSLSKWLPAEEKK